MALPQESLSSSTNRSLPPIAINGHALFEFSMRMNRALKRFEKRFDAREVVPVPVSRQLWQGPPKQPR